MRAERVQGQTLPTTKPCSVPPCPQNGRALGPDSQPRGTEGCQRLTHLPHGAGTLGAGAAVGARPRRRRAPHGDVRDELVAVAVLRGRRVEAPPRLDRFDLEQEQAGDRSAWVSTAVCVRGWRSCAAVACSQWYLFSSCCERSIYFGLESMNVEIWMGELP